MSDKQGNPPADAYRQHRAEFRAEWEAAVPPLEELAIEADKAALSFVQMGLRTSLILNGGALVLTPAYMTLFKIPAASPHVTLIAGATCFVLGLVFSWICMLIGFFAMATASDRSYARRDSAAHRVIRSHYYLNDEQKSSEATAKIEESNKQDEALRSRFMRLRKWGIVLSCVAMLLFIGGAILAGQFVVINGGKT